ncbi:MAG: 5'/3'-nucleotidase SurE [Bdellovibrionales bacterium]
MNILISNDDGIASQGMLGLADALESLGAQVLVVAPQFERSTTGHSLTLHKPLRLKEVAKNRFYVSGSPADCVYMATRHLLNKKPDLLVTGVNYGANLGQDIYYSGTVAAAREGSFFGIKSIAMSLCLQYGEEVPKFHWESAFEFAKKLIPRFHASSFPATHVLNVNVPNISPKEIRGVKFGVQGKRIYTDSVEECTDPRGKKYYWVGGTLHGHDNLAGSDCNLVQEGYISLTALRSNATDIGLLEEFSEWESLKI